MLRLPPRIASVSSLLRSAGQIIGFRGKRRQRCFSIDAYAPAIRYVMLSGERPSRKRRPFAVEASLPSKSSRSISTHSQGHFKEETCTNTSARDASRAGRERASSSDRRAAQRYGQRFAESSQPAARTGCGAGTEGDDGTGMRAVACGPPTAVARAGFPTSAMDSFSSESSGATSRRASTSFSSRVNSISFCRNTSYTFFIDRAPVRIVFGCRSLSRNFSRVACVVKRFRVQKVPQFGPLTFFRRLIRNLASSAE